MSAAYIQLASRLQDQTSIECLVTALERAGTPIALFDVLDTGLDDEHVRDATIVDAVVKNEWLRVSLETSTGFSNDTVSGLFAGLAAIGAGRQMALEYNSRVGMYCCMVPGDGEAAYVEHCIDGFERSMERLEEAATAREQLDYCLQQSLLDSTEERIEAVLAAQRKYHADVQARERQSRKAWEPIRSALDAGDREKALRLINERLPPRPESGN